MISGQEKRAGDMRRKLFSTPLRSKDFGYLGVLEERWA
jgi:hypothetical protein